MIREKKHFMKTVHAGGGRGFHCTCCTPGPNRQARKQFLRAARRAYNQFIKKEILNDLD